MDSFHLTDALSHSLGISCTVNYNHRFAKRFTTIPVAGTVDFLHAQNGAVLVSMEITERESPGASENSCIGYFELEQGTLHKPGAHLELKWTIEESFDLLLTAADSEKRELRWVKYLSIRSIIRRSSPPSSKTSQRIPLCSRKSLTSRIHY